MKSIKLKQVWKTLRDFLPSQEILSNMLKKKADTLLVVDSSSNLKMMNIVKVASEMEITALEAVELPIDKRDEFIRAALVDFQKKNCITHKNAVLIPYLGPCLLKHIQLPALPEKELPEAIKWQLKEEAGFDLSAALLDYRILKKTVKEDGSNLLDIICIAAGEEQIKRQVLLLKQAGFSCLAVTPLHFAYTGLIARYFKDKEGEARAILHIDEDNCYLNIYNENSLYSSRELPVSVNKLKEALAVRLSSDSGKVNIEFSADEIEEVLFKIGVPLEDIKYKGKHSSFQIFSMLRQNLERLTSELSRSLSYYESLFNSKPVSKILIAGSGGKIPNIERFLAKELSLNVAKISLADSFKFSAGVNLENIRQACAGMGAAISYAQNINLLPDEFRRESLHKAERLFLRWAAFLTFSLLLVSYILSRAIVGAYEKRLENTLLHLNILSEVKRTKEKVDALSNFIAETKYSEPQLGEALAKLSQSAPRELFINNFSLDCASKAGAINGFVKTTGLNPNAILTKFAGEMAGCGYFTDVSISSVERISQEAIVITNFKINFKLL